MDLKMTLRKEYFGNLLYNPVDWSLKIISDADAERIKKEMRGKIISFENPREKILSAPLKVFIAVSSRCNLGCRHCLFSKKRGPVEELSLDELSKIFKVLGAMGVLELRIGGFEVTVREDFQVIFSEARKNNLVTSMNTNGVFDDSMRKKLADSLIDRVHVSLDGLEKNNDFLRGKGSFKEALKTVKYLKERGKYVRIAVCLFKENLEDIPGLLKISEELDCDIKFSPISPLGSAEKLQGILSAEENEKLKKYFDGLKSNANIFFNYGPVSLDFFDYCNLSDFDSTKCGSGRTQMRVENNGKVFIAGCGDIFLEEGAVGTSEDSFEEMWVISQRKMSGLMKKKGAKCEGCTIDKAVLEWIKAPTPAFNFYRK